MLTVRAVDVSIGSVSILRNISMHVEKGQFVGLIGRNGAGKTTLLRSLMGLQPARAGEISFDGQPLRPLPAHRRAHLGIGYMPEDRRLIPELTVEENILLPAWATHLERPRERLDRVYAWIPEVQQLRERRALQLSGGQQKLVALGRALMCGTRLLLVDEPFEGVAPVLARRLAEVISQLKREGLSVLVAESDLSHSRDLLDNVFLIDRGAVTEQRRQEKLEIDPGG
jgi:branched-chain amino acid transport system ATP-binding protein